MNCYCSGLDRPLVQAAIAVKRHDGSGAGDRLASAIQMEIIQFHGINGHGIAARALAIFMNKTGAV